MTKIVLLTLSVLFLTACSSPATPTALPPTPDLRATESQIALNIFATMTANAPTATRTPTITATPTSTSTSIPPSPTRTVSPTVVLSPTRVLSPTPTSEAWRSLCSQIPKGMAGLVVTSYIGEKEIVVLVGKDKYIVNPRGEILVPLPMGLVEITFTAPGWGKSWNWVEKYNVVTVGRCERYEIWYTRN